MQIVLQDEQIPALILLDLMLPHLGGIEFLSIIRGRPELSHIPVIVCTALAETAEIRGKIAKDIQGYLVKPIRKDKLLEKAIEVLHPITIRINYQN